MGPVASGSDPTSSAADDPMTLLVAHTAYDPMTLLVAHTEFSNMTYSLRLGVLGSLQKSVRPKTLTD
jgi:hypothetical protein